LPDIDEADTSVPLQEFPMRTITNFDHYSGDNLVTLRDVSAALAVREPNRLSNDNDIDVALGVKSPPASSRKASRRKAKASDAAAIAPAPVAIPKALADAADATLAAALAGEHPVDPLLGPSLSCLTSAVNSAVKRSGSLIEKAIIAGFEQAGFMVFPQVAMQLTDAAKDLVKRNAPGSLRGVVIKADAPAAEEPLVVYDMLVVHPGRRHATLIEVKRGSGNTEIRKIAPITATLLAGGLQATSFLRAKGIKVRSVDAKVIDYYGRSGFGDHVRVAGDQMDAYFKAPIKPLVEAVLARVKTRLFTALPDLLNTALVQARGAANDNGRARDEVVTLPGGATIAKAHLPAVDCADTASVRGQAKAKIGAKKNKLTSQRAQQPRADRAPYRRATTHA
jgi:hypothetical protein